MAFGNGEMADDSYQAAEDRVLVVAAASDGRFMAAWRASVGDPAPVSYRMFNADGTPATVVLTFGARATLIGSIGSVVALSNDN